MVVGGSTSTCFSGLLRGLSNLSLAYTSIIPTALVVRSHVQGAEARFHCVVCPASLVKVVGGK